MSQRDDASSVSDPHMAANYRAGDGPFGDGSVREGKGLPQITEQQASLGECDGHVPPQFPPLQSVLIFYPIGWWGKGSNGDLGHFVTACY